MSLSAPSDDIKFMQRAMALARAAESQAEVPVGAVLVREGVIIGEGFNSPIKQNDVSAHAELMALRDACQSQGNYRLPNSTLYVTLEPCAMCAGAIIHARVKRVVIATREPRAGAGGSLFNILDNEKMNHRCLVEYGLLSEESSALLQGFFKEKRNAAKERKRLEKNQ